MRDITKKDRAVFLELVQQWATCLPNVELDKVELVEWLRFFDDDVIRRGIEVTGGWYLRTVAKGTTLENEDAHRYATAVMRNTARNREVVKDMLGDEGGAA
jgi:hypothetical protein